MSNRYVSTLFSSGEEFEDFLKEMKDFKDDAEKSAFCALSIKGTFTLPATYDVVANKTTPYKNSYLITYFNRTPIVGEFFTGIGIANSDGVAFSYIAKVVGAPVESNGNKFVPFEMIHVVTHVQTADKATSADSATKATQDANGNVISSTYAKKDELADGTITVKNATNATNATKDADDNVIPDTYAKKNDLTSGAITVKNATNATSADSATKATQDGDGNNIPNTYAKKTDLNDYVKKGEVVVTPVTKSYMVYVTIKSNTETDNSFIYFSFVAKGSEPNINSHSTLLASLKAHMSSVTAFAASGYFKINSDKCIVTGVNFTSSAVFVKYAKQNSHESATTSLSTGYNFSSVSISLTE